MEGKTEAILQKLLFHHKWRNVTDVSLKVNNKEQYMRASLESGGSVCDLCGQDNYLHLRGERWHPGDKALVIYSVTQLFLIGVCWPLILNGVPGAIPAEAWKRGRAILRFFSFGPRLMHLCITSEPAQLVQDAMRGYLDSTNAVTQSRKKRLSLVY